MSDFSNVPPRGWVASNDLAFAIRDRYPVSPGHSLVITKCVVPTWFEATTEEQSAAMSLVRNRPGNPSTELRVAT
jgi:diadenosine tetraphosphate (Ap4A) HIT family hydrolase